MAEYSTLKLYMEIKGDRYILSLVHLSKGWFDDYGGNLCGLADKERLPEGGADLFAWVFYAVFVSGDLCGREYYQNE